MTRKEAKRLARKYQSFRFEFFERDFNEQLSLAFYECPNKVCRVRDFKEALFNGDISFPRQLTQSQYNLLQRMRINVPSRIAILS